MSKVSIFNNILETKVSEDMDLKEYLEAYRDGSWLDIMLDYRSITDEDKRKQFKKTIPTVTLSGTFDYRRDSSLKKHSGYLAMDLDNVPDFEEVKKKLKRDKYIFSIFTSIGGKGLRPIFKIDPLKHREAFLGLQEYLFEQYDLKSCIDTNGKNVSKPYLVGYDPDLYINPNEVPVFKLYIKETFIKSESDYVHTTDDFTMVLQQIKNGSVQIYDTYNDWLKLGFALAHQFGENGRSYFHDISCFWSKYNTKDTDDQYKACLRDKSSNPAKISTFYFLARSHGININTEQTKKILRATRNGRKVGLSQEKILENLRKTDNISGAEDVVKQIFDSDSRSEEEEETIIHQLELYISSNFSLRMNLVTGYLEQNKKILTENDLNSVFISAKKMIPKLDYQLMMRLLKSDFVESYNPFFEFFKSDGIAVKQPATPVPNEGFESPLINLLASTIINKEPGRTVYFLRKWIVSTVSAAHGVHSPLQLALLGPQDTGKTEFLRRLPPPELMEYYAESKLEKGKDDEILMTQCLWLMDDEMAGKTRQEAAKMKNITSTQFYYLRRPYGDHNEKIMRLAVLCGTSNYREVLNDPTGNRRVICIDVEDIDKELYNTIDKSKLYLEAMSLYKSKFDWRITETDRPFLNKNEETYTIVSKEQELLLKYFSPGEEHFLTTTDIMVELNRLTDLKLSVLEVGKYLNSMKFKKKSVRDGFSTAKRWGVIRVNRMGEDESLPHKDPF